MRILCDVHGCQPCRQVSPDLLPGRAAATDGVVIVTYECDRQIVDAYFLSREFADVHRIAGGVSQLPEEYAVWTRETVIVCERCFSET